MWRLGLVWMAHALDRDLQAAARRAGDPHVLWTATGSHLARIWRGDDKAATQWKRARAQFDAVVVSEVLERHGAWCLCDTPEPLTQLPDPPFALLGRGAQLRSPVQSAPVIAVVGSRRPTSRGLTFARTLGRGLAERGAVVVSGLALGVDAAAHEGALDGGGPTIAVLGSSVDQVAPKSNAALSERILGAGGTVVSEYWFDTAPAPWRFPARNRIVAGLADAVVVVEAAERSGALITADFALDLGRPVLAVPGPAGAPMSAGCHHLIRAGAALCEGPDDVVNELASKAWSRRQGPDVPALDGVDAKIVSELAREPQLLDDLVAATGDAAVEVLTALGRLELDGRVHRVGAMWFAAVSP